MDIALLLDRANLNIEEIICYFMVSMKHHTVQQCDFYHYNFPPHNTIQNSNYQLRSNFQIDTKLQKIGLDLENS